LVETLVIDSLDCYHHFLCW